MQFPILPIFAWWQRGRSAPLMTGVADMADMADVWPKLPILPIFADGWGRMTGRDRRSGEFLRRFRRNFEHVQLPEWPE
jgi:hypothetical protein